MDRFTAMQIFIRVAELESFTQAAESLGMPKASISTSIQQLESFLGTRLLQRTTRKVQLTADGTAFLERSKDLLSDLDEVESLFKQDANLTGRIRVDMAIGIAKNAVIPRLHEFLEKYPMIEIELGSTDRKVDLIQEGYDCVVRVGELQDSGLMVKPLGKFKVISCASPAYIKKYGLPKNVEDLKNHYLIQYASNFGKRDDAFEYFDGEKYRNMKLKSFMTVNNTESYLGACLAGLGIIQAPESGLREYLKRKELVEILPRLNADPMKVSLIYPHKRNLPKRVKVFMEWMEEVIKDYIL